VIEFLVFVIRFIFGTTEEDHEIFRKEVLGEFTREELIQIEREEKENYNHNIRSAFWWSGSKTWIDSNGKEREF